MWKIGLLHCSRAKGLGLGSCSRGDRRGGSEPDVSQTFEHQRWRELDGAFGGQKYPSRVGGSLLVFSIKKGRRFKEAGNVQGGGFQDMTELSDAENGEGRGRGGGKEQREGVSGTGGVRG